MNKKTILFYGGVLLVALVVLFAPIGIKFYVSELYFVPFVASLEYGLDVATTIGFVGAIFVFWVTKQKEYREEKQLQEDKKKQEKKKKKSFNSWAFSQSLPQSAIEDLLGAWSPNAC